MGNLLRSTAIETRVFYRFATPGAIDCDIRQASIAVEAIRHVSRPRLIPRAVDTSQLASLCA